MVEKPAVREVQLKDTSIRLGQLLKLADLAGSGADAKVLLDGGTVRVNGQPEARRGRQLVAGDVVQVGEQTVRVTAGS